MSNHSVQKVNLDTDAGLRQAIGAQYARTKITGDRLALLKQGEVLLPPHPKWKGDYTDWTSDPYNDRNWKFQFHTLRWINPLLWAALDGDKESHVEWLRIVKSWYQENLPAKKSTTSFAWKDMADGNRAVQLSIGAILVSSEDYWFQELLEAHKNWLMDDRNIVSGNHALHQNVGLFVVGAVLQEPAAMKTARDRMLTQFWSAFDEEGINEEGSIAYHQMNIQWWSRTASRVALENMPFPSEVTTRLDKAADALAHLVMPNGRLPQIGDSARGRIKLGINEHCDYVASGGERGSSPAALVRNFTNGYYISRSGWGEVRTLQNESHLILRHGTRMIGHAHQDRGSVHIYSEGSGWLVDSGFYSYQTRDATRKYLDSREAHNVASLSDVPYSEPKNVPITFADETPDFHHVELEDRGFLNNVMRRRITYLIEPNCWIIHDSNSGDAAGDIRQSWHVDVGIRINRHDRGFTLRRKDTSLVMSWLGRTPRLKLHRAVEGDLRGWIGTKWKTLEPGSLITADTPVTGRGLVSLIAPNRGTERLGVVQSYVASTGTIQATLVRGARTWSLTIDSNDVTLSEL